MAVGTHPPVIPAAEEKVIYKVLIVRQAPCPGCDQHYLISSSQPYGKQILLLSLLLRR